MNSNSVIPYGLEIDSIRTVGIRDYTENNIYYSYEYVSTDGYKFLSPPQNFCCHLYRMVVNNQVNVPSFGIYIVDTNDLDVYQLDSYRFVTGSFRQLVTYDYSKPILLNHGYSLRFEKGSGSDGVYISLMYSLFSQV